MKKKLLVAAICVASISITGHVFAAPSPNASGNATEKKANAGQGKANSGQQSPKAGEKANNGNAGNNPKVEIAHCGCNYDGSGLAWKHIRVSTRAKGHLKHTAGSSATCIYLDEEVSYTRAAADCRISNGEPSNNIGGLLDCEPVPAIGDSCTAEPEPPLDGGVEEI